MLKKSITFQDLDGNSLTEDFYFNLNKTELFELNLTEGGLQEKLSKIIAEEDGQKIVAMMNDIVKSAYGVRSDDNKRFIKNDEVWEDFQQSDAHSELLWELYTDAAKSAAFIRGVVPSEFSDKMENFEELSAEEIRKKAVEQMQGHKTKES